MNNYTESKTFCPVPFMSVMVDTQQQLRFCCIADGEDNIIKINGARATAGYHRLLDAFNSPHMAEIRRKMANGEKVEGCKRCYYEEEVLKNNSPRYHTQLDYAGLLGEENYHKRIQEMIDNDFFSNETPVHLDLRLGNRCNLQCRMCNPWSSSQIAKEHLTLMKESDRYQTVWTGGSYDDVIMFKEKNEWFEGDFLWEEIISFIPNLKKVYMTGGEPTLVNGNFKFMEKCIELGCHDKITLSFNTNLTNINKKFLNLISQFETVVINASLDGVGKTTEYIRYPSDWNTQVKNLTQIAQLPNVKLYITPVMVLYNVLESDKILEFAKEFSIKNNREVELDYLHSGDDVYNPKILPKQYREHVADRVEKNWLNDDWVNSSIMTKNSVKRLISICRSETMDDYENCLEKFKTMTEIYDESRSQSFKETFPELYKVIYEDLAKNKINE